MIRSHRLLRPAVLTATLAATLAIAGCSSSGGDTGSGRAAAPAASSSAPSKPTDPSKFVSDSLDAFEGAPSAHVSGSGESDGGSFSLDIKYGDHAAIGTITTQGKRVELTRTADGTTYLKGGADFWSSSGIPAGVVAALADKYVKVSEDAAGFAALAKLLDRSQFVDAFRPSDSDLDGSEVTGPKQVDGVSCFGVVDSGSDGGSFYAAADGTPYPVQLTNTGEGTLDFDGYTDTVDVPTPDPSEVVEFPSDS